MITNDPLWVLILCIILAYGLFFLFEIIITLNKERIKSKPVKTLKVGDKFKYSKGGEWLETYTVTIIDGKGLSAKNDNYTNLERYFSFETLMNSNFIISERATQKEKIWVEYEVVDKNS